MNKVELATGVAHEIPADLRKALLADESAVERWESLTPLARNEWICWTINVKTDATRAKHVERVITELNEGVRRPCCWIGCIHRTDKPLSKSVQWVLDRQKAKAK